MSGTLVPMSTGEPADTHENFKMLRNTAKKSGEIKIFWYRGVPDTAKFQFMLTPDNASHAVLIYSLDNDKFKIKDSYGRKYEIPINRPDSLQVKIQLEIF